METEPKSFWVNLIKEHFVDSKVICIKGVPSIEEQHRMTEEEKARIEQQIANLEEEGLKQKGEELEKAIAFNEKSPPTSMLRSIPVPSTDSINFHEIVRYSSDVANEKLDLTQSPVFTYFDHVNTNFVYVSIILKLFFFWLLCYILRREYHYGNLNRLTARFFKNLICVDYQ